MKIKEVKKEKGDRKLIAAQKKKKVLKQGVLRKKDLKKLTLYIKNGANCPCSQLDSLGSSFLIMGRKVDQQLLLMSIHKWDKKSKELKFAIKYMKSHQCPTYHTVFQWCGTSIAPHVPPCSTHLIHVSVMCPWTPDPCQICYRPTTQPWSSFYSLSFKHQSGTRGDRPDLLRRIRHINGGAGRPAASSE